MMSPRWRGKPGQNAGDDCILLDGLQLGLVGAGQLRVRKRHVDVEGPVATPVETELTNLQGVQRGDAEVLVACMRQQRYD